ncbi:hypothetical protein [Conexibacter sp. S30A1]|nr:hypothetical protein [Conexibacter sp. S30A1]
MSATTRPVMTAGEPVDIDGVHAPVRASEIPMTAALAVPAPE